MKQTSGYVEILWREMFDVLFLSLLKSLIATTYLKLML